MKKKILFFIAALGAASLLFAAERDRDKYDYDSAGKQGAPGKSRGQQKKAAKEAEPVKAAAPARKAEGGGRAVAPAGTVPPSGTWSRPKKNVPAEGRPGREIRPDAGTVVVPGVKAPPGRTIPRTEPRPRREQVNPGINVRPAKARSSRPDVIIYTAPPPAAPQPARAENPGPSAGSGAGTAQPSGPVAAGPAPARRRIMRNDEAFSSIRREQRSETMRNHYYWHRNGGLRYAHYFDSRNAHWYGFYQGRRLYWCRYYGDRWWRHDSARARWLYWWSGYWWWRGPASVAFVYVDNNYYPYEMAPGITVVRAPDTENPPQPPPSPDMGRLWTSPDDSRLVQVYGDDSDAFLYDHSDIPPVYLAYLGRGVVNVKFTEDPDDQVTVFFKDGTMAAYDMGGHPVEVPDSEPPQLEPPPAPESVPPAPESVPED